MQSKLLAESFWRSTQTISMTALFERENQNIGDIATKYPPGHFQITIRRNRDERGRRSFRERATKRPPTQDIPLLDFRQSLQFQELVFSCLWQFNVIYWRFHI